MAGTAAVALTITLREGNREQSELGNDQVMAALQDPDRRRRVGSGAASGTNRCCSGPCQGADPTQGPHHGGARRAASPTPWPRRRPPRDHLRPSASDTRRSTHPVTICQADPAARAPGRPDRRHETIACFDRRAGPHPRRRDRRTRRRPPRPAHPTGSDSAGHQWRRPRGRRPAPRHRRRQPRTHHQRSRRSRTSAASLPSPPPPGTPPASTASTEAATEPPTPRSTASSCAGSATTPLHGPTSPAAPAKASPRRTSSAA